MEQIEQKVLDVFASIFGREGSLESSQETMEDWTSLRHLQLVLGLEEEFEIELAPERFQELKSLREFADEMSKLMKT